MEPFLVRLLIGALIIWLVQAITGAMQLNAEAARIINVLAIIGAVLYILFGSFLPFK